MESQALSQGVPFRVIPVWLRIAMLPLAGLVIGTIASAEPLWGGILLAGGLGFVAVGTLPTRYSLAVFLLLIPFSVRIPLESAPLDMARLLYYSIFARALVSRRRLTRLPFGMSLLAFGLLAWGGVTTITSIDPFNSVRVMYNTLSFVAVLWGIVHLVKDDARVKLFARCLFIAGVILSLVALLQFIAGVFTGPAQMRPLYLRIVYLFEGPRVFQRTAHWPTNYYANWYSPALGLVRAIGTSMTPMGLAQILLFSFFPLLTVALVQPKRQARWLLIVAAVTEGLAILVTLSRGAWLSLGIGGLVLLHSLWLRRIRIRRKTLVRLIALGIILLGVLTVLAPSSIRQALVEAAVSVVRPREATVRQFRVSNEARFETYRAGVEIIKHNPLVGVGPGNFHQEAGYRRGGSTHNVYLDVAAEMGLMGVILYAGILLSALWNFWSVMNRSSNVFYRALSTGWLASLVAVMVYWNFTPYFFEPKIGLTLWSVLGMSIVLRRMTRSESISSLNHL